jgi:hypothetical protein
MPDPEDPIDPQPYVRFLLERLYRPCGADGAAHAAVETERAVDGDVWVWTDDNAKVFELLSHPEIWRRHPAETAEVLRFLRSMCEGQFIFRRIAEPRLVQAADGNWLHTMMDVGADPAAGLTVLGVRFHDGRTAKNLRLTGNYVQFVHRGTLFTLDVEEAIDEAEVDAADGRLHIRHSGEMRFTAGDETHRLGRLTYSTSLDSRSMVIHVDVELLLDPGIEVADVVLTIGHDDLSHGETNVHYGRIGVLRADGGTDWHLAQEPGSFVLPAAGAAYYSLAQDELHGFALGIHTRTLDPARLQELRVVVNVPERLHWVVAAYSFPGPHSGTRLAMAEEKLLTTGGFYQEVPAYAALLAGAARPAADAWPRDLSISYDYGVEINAFAKGYAALAGQPDPAAAALAAELQRLTDRYLDVYQRHFIDRFWDGDNAVFSRQLAFVAMASATMLRATGEERYRSRLAEQVDVLLQFEKPLPHPVAGPESGFLMGLRSSRDVYLDCHAAVLLALALAQPWLEDPRIAPAIDHGLNALALVTDTIELGGEGLRKVDTLGIRWVDDAGEPRLSNAYWNYQAALCLRLLRVLRLTADPRLLQVTQEKRHRQRLITMAALLRQQIDRSTTARDAGLEIRTGSWAPETNSETQPWAVLGLVGHPFD